MIKRYYYDDDHALIQTTGGWVHGYEYDGVSVFKGIPYAKARRFHAPEPTSWEGVKETIGYSYTCPVFESTNPVDHPESLAHIDATSEDCQNLNIWTPGLDGKKRPVMFWLHGGAMSFGSANCEDTCTGEVMAKEGNVVMVAPNHRLNGLGFCDLSDYGEEYKNSGNSGLQDMVAALEWVRDNIEKFGGDPENVTIFGHSGGGMKCTALIQSKAADGLFHKAVILSGVQGGAMCDCVGSGKQMAEFLMEELGLSSVKELETVEFSKFARAFVKMRMKYKFHGVNAGEMPFRSDYYVGDPGEVPFREETKHIPILVGSTFGEFDAGKDNLYRKHTMSEVEMMHKIVEFYGAEIAEAAVPLFRKTYPERPIIDLLSMDFMFRTYILDYVKKRSALNDCTWTYLYNQDVPANGGTSPAHGKDLAYVFGTIEKVPGLQEPGVSGLLKEQIFGCVMAFAHTGNPNHPGLPVTWEISKPDSIKTLVFDKNTRLLENYDTELNELMAGTLLKKQLDGLYASVAGDK